MRVGAHDDLAVQLEDQAQHTVGGGMLRPEVQRVIAYLSHLPMDTGKREKGNGKSQSMRGFSRFPLPFSRCSNSMLRPKITVLLLTNDPRRDLARLDRHGLINHALLIGVVPHFDVSRERKVLAERMADESVVGENAAQIRMPAEHDAEQVERFTLEPIRARPDTGE